MNEPWNRSGSLDLYKETTFNLSQKENDRELRYLSSENFVNKLKNRVQV